MTTPKPELPVSLNHHVTIDQNCSFCHLERHKTFYGLVAPSDFNGWTSMTIAADEIASAKRFDTLCINTASERTRSNEYLLKTTGGLSRE